MKHQPVGTGALKREMGLGSALILVIANMVGTGVFTTSGFIVGELGSAQSLLLCWLVGGLFALTGALCYAELGAMMPQAGGEYVYLRRTFGKLPAFLSGWISLIVGFSAPIAAAAIAFATYLLGGERRPWFTLECMGHSVASLSATTVLAICVVVALSLIHHHSVRLGRRVQNALTAFKIGIILVFAGAGLCFGDGNVSHITNFLSSTPGPVFTSGFAVSLIFVSFAYSGWNAAAYLGGEIKQPGKNVPLALIFGTLAVIGMYLVLNVVYIYALPVEAMQGKLNLGTLAATTLFGTALGKGTGLAIAFGLLSVISAMIMAGPRVYYAMACDGVFFKKICQVKASGHSPSRSIQLQAGLAILMIVSATFETLLAYIGFTLALSSLLTVCGLIRLRITAPDAPRPYRTLGYPFTPLLFICGNVWIIVHSLASQPMAGLCGLGTVLLGGLCFKLLNPGNSGGNSGMRPQTWDHRPVEQCPVSGGSGLGGQGK
jgi:APA family basic amino acid/polyamine antiporter